MALSLAEKKNTLLVGVVNKLQVALIYYKSVDLSIMAIGSSPYFQQCCEGDFMSIGPQC